MKRREQQKKIVPLAVVREPLAPPICREFRAGVYAVQTGQIRLGRLTQGQVKPRTERMVRAFAVGSCNSYKAYSHGCSPRC